MKKLIIIVAIALMSAVAAKAQTGVTLIRSDNDRYIVNNLDMSKLSAADTSLYFALRKPVDKSWSMQVLWTGAAGEGTVDLEVTNFSNLTGWVAYADSLSATITGARGSVGWEDYIWAWDYGRLKLTKGTISKGKLSVVVKVK